jgi:hypothetical protein
MSQTHIYYNVDLVNNQTVDYRNQPILSYQENRDQPILENAQDYYFSIIRFELNGLGRNIPLCIPVIEEGDKNPTSDVNQTITELVSCITVWTVMETIGKTSR